MPTSLIKYVHSRRSSGGQRLFWDRTEIDGYPYRGPHAPLMSNDEFEDKAVKVADFRNAFFDVVDPGENRQYQEVMECVQNGWFCLAFIDRFWHGTTQHYVEWVEFYMQDGSRAPFALSQGFTEVAGGQQPFYPGAG